jgi:MFS family permease
MTAVGAPDLRVVASVVSAIAIADTLFAGSLAPLIPSLDGGAPDHHIPIGILVAAHTLGSLLGALLALVLSSRWTIRSIAASGLAISVLACALFAVAGANGLQPTMAAARAMHGLGTAIAWVGALSWLASSGSSTRRGSRLGGGVAALLLGGALGPLLGGVAATYSVLWPFLALAVVKAGLCLTALTVVPSTPASVPWPPVRSRAAVSHGICGAMLVYLLPAVALGVLNVLAPLELSGGGQGASGIAVIFAAGAACQSVACLGMGMWIDASGARVPVIAAGALGVVTAMVLGHGHSAQVLPGLVIAALITFSMLMTPSLAQLTDRLERLRIGAPQAFALTVLLWTPGSVLGAVGGSWLADALTRSAAYIVVALVMAAAVPVAARWT